MFQPMRHCYAGVSRCGLIASGTAALLIALGSASANAGTTSWMTSGAGLSGQFIAIDISGNVYIDDPQSGTIKKYSGTGSNLGTVGPRASSFLGLAAAPGGGVEVGYLASGFHITQYDSAGNAVRTISFSSGTGPGQVSAVLDFATDGAGNIYVLDSAGTTPGAQNRVDQFSSTGSFVTSWGSSGDGPGQFDFFNLRGSVAVGGDGSVYVTDNTNRTQRFSSSGAFLKVWGSTGTNPGQFGSTWGLAADATGHVYVGESNTTNPYAAQAFDTNGNFLGAVPQGQDFGLATFGDNLVYANSGNRIVRYDLTQPDATLLLSPGSVVSGQPVTATAQATVPFGTITSYRYDFGDGTPPMVSASATATHAYARPGSYPVTVQVTSQRGGTATASKSAKVSPAPPPGRVGVSINEGDYATNNPAVRLDLVWPSGASQALISNDGGFGASAATVALAARVPWRLRRTGPDRLPKTVYVRYLDAGIDNVNLTDDIILDQTPPTMQAATWLGTARATSPPKGKRRRTKSYRIRIKAKDAIAGVCAVTASASRSRGTTKTLSNCHKRGLRRVARVITMRLSSKPRYVRVKNSAGTWSRWIKLRHARR